MRDPIETAISRATTSSYVIGMATATVVLTFDIPLLWSAIVAGFSAFPVAFAEGRASRKVYGHMYDQIRRERGWV